MPPHPDDEMPLVDRAALASADQPTADGHPGEPPYLLMRHITKTFPGVVANHRVTLEVRAGEIHALLGENGAGKTTLMHILYGLYQPDAGEILLQGRPVRIRSPRAAIALGIGLVPQQLLLVRRHTVAENIALGLPGTRFLCPTRQVEARIRMAAEQHGLAIDPRARIWQLSAGEQQRVEILKALVRGAQVLILDEPTGMLTPQEREALFQSLARVAAAGRTVIFITHKLDEVSAIANRMTVLRKGKVVATLSRGEANQKNLARLMVGREVIPERPRPPWNPGEAVLTVSRLWAQNDQQLPALRGISFSVHAGEILGVAGVALFSPIPAPWLLPGMFVTGFVAGSLWGCLPALLKLKLGVNEVITTLMLNYIALYLVQWLIYGPWKGKSMHGFAYTDPFPQGAWLPLIPGTRVHWPTLVLGVVLAVGIAFLLSRTRLGYEVRVIGHNPEAARYAGIDAARVTLLVMLISGGAAGLAGVGEVAGIHHKLLGPTQISLGYGYTAIIVAWLARGNPLAGLLGRGWEGVPLHHPLPDMSIPGLSLLPLLGPALFTGQSPLTYLGLMLAVVLWWLLYHTRWGIVLRACGESPAAADAAGVSVSRVRYLAVILGGALAGVAGGYLSVAYRPSWTEGMTAGMGWIVLALTALVKHRHWRGAPEALGLPYVRGER